MAIVGYYINSNLLPLRLAEEALDVFRSSIVEVDVWVILFLLNHVGSHELEKLIEREGLSISYLLIKSRCIEGIAIEFAECTSLNDTILVFQRGGLLSVLEIRRRCGYP